MEIPIEAHPLEVSVKAFLLEIFVQAPLMEVPGPVDPGPIDPGAVDRGPVDRLSMNGILCWCSFTHSPPPVASAARALIEELRQPSAGALRAARFARPNGSLRSLVGRFAPSLVLIHSLPSVCC